MSLPSTKTDTISGFMDATVISSCLSTLKHILKEQGISYATLAEKLEVSVVTIKRMLNQADIPMGRFLALCRIAGMEPSALIARAEAGISETGSFSREQDETFCRHPHLFQFLVTLIGAEGNVSTVASHYDLDQVSVYLYLRKLENMGVLNLLPGEQVRLNTKQISFAPSSRFIRLGFSMALKELAENLGNQELPENFHYSFLFLYESQHRELMGELSKVIDRWAYKQVDINGTRARSEPVYRFLLMSQPYGEAEHIIPVPRIKDGDLD